MPTYPTVQYTVRGVSKEVDDSLRLQAERRGISLNQLIVEGLREISQIEALRKQRSLDFLRGNWMEDPEFDAAMADQRCIDPELWQ